MCHCVGPKANLVIAALISWFEGSGYTLKAMCDTNTKDFASMLHKLADKICGEHEFGVNVSRCHAI